jgi:hypothetical protein
MREYGEGENALQSPRPVSLSQPRRVLSSSVRSCWPALSSFTARSAGTTSSTTEQANWHPVTWLSHALDCELFGLDAGYHQLTSAVIHRGRASWRGLRHGRAGLCNGRVISSSKARHRNDFQHLHDGRDFSVWSIGLNRRPHYLQPEP